MTFFGDLMNICILGNSKRSNILFSNLLNNGLNVELIRSMAEIPLEIKSDIVVMPIPTTICNGYLNLPGDKKKIEEIVQCINKKSLIITCNYFSNTHKTIDLNKREDFTYLNAIPTAEGAIELAIKESEKSLAYSSALITGFGHVGKILADRIKRLFKNVTIAARSPHDLSYAQALGYETINIYELSDQIHRFDTIFQTVPSLIIGKKEICYMKDTAIVIELSSGSVGTDTKYTKEAGCRVIDAPALPTRVAPVTAGEILTKCVLSIITKENSFE